MNIAGNFNKKSLVWKGYYFETKFRQNLGNQLKVSELGKISE